MNLHDIMLLHSRRHICHLHEIVRCIQGVHQRTMPSEIRPDLDEVHTAIILAYAGNYNSVMPVARVALFNDIVSEARVALNDMLKPSPYNAKLVLASNKLQAF